MCIIQENHLNEPFTDVVNQIIFFCAGSVLLSLNKWTGEARWKRSIIKHMQI